MKRLLILILTRMLLLTLVPSGQAKTRVRLGKIQGKVISAVTGKAIPGTAVRIDNTVVPTNRAGKFGFIRVYPGIYTIHFDAPGHIGQSLTINVRPGRTARVPTRILSPGSPQRRYQALKIIFRYQCWLFLLF